MIKLQAIGNLGKDAIINQVNGKQVINFTVAHTEKYKDAQGQQVEKTTWIEAAYWSDSKVGPYLKKGTQVYLEGTPEVRTYPKNDGSTGASLSVRVLSVQLLGGGGDKSEAPTNVGYKKSSTEEPNKSVITPRGGYDDLPF